LALNRSRSEVPDLYPENTNTTGQSKNGDGFKDIIGQSDRMQETFRLIEKVADSDSTVLIYGESGTGKELVARAIHFNSYRKNKPLVPINCGAIPEDLLESELFGHVRGAFTGATTTRSGRFESADGGTIFLDEIGDMSARLQVKVLRVLQEKEFEPVGGNKTIKINVRIIAATHRDLEKAVQKGIFREDLFYRLNVIPITLPPLREKKSDIPLLISHFLDHFNKEKNQKVEGISEEAMKIIMRYSWPGNVRELKNLVEWLVVVKREGRILPEDLPEKLRRENNDVLIPKIEISDDGICLNTAVSEFEKVLILQSLKNTNWVKNKAAKLLHLNRTTLVEKIKRHRLQKRSF